MINTYISCCSAMVRMGGTKTTESVMLEVEHVQQQHTWDCGLACIMMVLQPRVRTQFSDALYQICQEEGIDKRFPEIYFPVQTSDRKSALYSRPLTFTVIIKFSSFTLSMCPNSPHSNVLIYSFCHGDITYFLSDVRHHLEIRKYFSFLSEMKFQTLVRYKIISE